MKRSVAKMIWSMAMAAVVLGWAMPCQAADDRPSKDPNVSWRHLEQPKIEIKEPQIGWSPVLQDSWMQCLVLDEVDLKRDAANALTLAQSLGMPVKPEFRDVLWQIVEDENLPVDCRMAAAQAYVAMGKPPQNVDLSATADRWPTALAVVLEPALAEWDHRPLRDIWLQRMQTADADPILVRVAVEALGTVREPTAEPVLTQLLLDSYQPFSLRFATARALSRLPSPRLVELAEALLDAPSANPMQWLLGVQLLNEQDSDAAIQLLERFADLEDRAVVGEALRQLLRVAPTKVIARAEPNVSDRDANVRAFTVEALATAGTPEHIQLLASALQDPVPLNRRRAREVLLQFAENETLLPHVVQEATAVLQADEWRGIEQALILLTKLQQRESRQRIFQLLDHDRGEVMETAAWSIKELAQPDWSEQSLAALQQQLERFNDEFTYASADTLTHLVEAMGTLQMQESLDLLRTFVPKDAPFTPTIRSAAVWAIGEVLQDQPQPDVVSELESRLNDANPILPEADSVRGLAAVSLGKMQSQGSMEYLVEWREVHGLNSFVGRRSAWAIYKLTGEPVGEVPTSTSNLGGWFVQPLD